jgi:putative flippase GtrA
VAPPAAVSRVAAALRGSLFGEMARFGAVGVVALAVDVIGFNLLRFAGGEGPLYDRPLTAKVLSVTASTTVAYVGNRLWTFRHQRSSTAAVHREFALFVLFSAIALGIAVACLAISHYALGFTSPLADNIAANVVGLGLATAFRFWSYRRWVFT